MVNQVEIIVRIIIFTLSGFFAGLFLEKFFLKNLVLISARTRMKLDDIMLGSLKGLISLFLALAGFFISAHLYGGTFVEKYHFNGISISLFIALITILSARIFTRLIKVRTADSSARQPSTSIILNITRIAIFLVGAMLVMQVFGISVTPILTALGVGGLAVALALQETLSNLFSGIQLIASRNIRNGDFIQLSTGEKGYVQDITWRNTIIRELSNNLIVVPNSKVSSAIITNYYLPEPELSVLVDLSVSYESDLDRVEALTVQTAKMVLQVTEGAVKEYEPFIRYHTFAESGIGFSVILRGNEFTSQYLIKHEFIKALYKAFREHKIEIPFPQRSVTIKDMRGPSMDK